MQEDGGGWSPSKEACFPSQDESTTILSESAQSSPSWAATGLNGGELLSSVASLIDMTPQCSFSPCDHSDQGLMPQEHQYQGMLMSQEHQYQSTEEYQYQSMDEFGIPSTGVWEGGWELSHPVAGAQATETMENGWLVEVPVADAKMRDSLALQQLQSNIQTQGLTDTVAEQIANDLEAIWSLSASQGLEQPLSVHVLAMLMSEDVIGMSQDGVYSILLRALLRIPPRYQGTVRELYLHMMATTDAERIRASCFHATGCSSIKDLVNNECVDTQEMGRVITNGDGALANLLNLNRSLLLAIIGERNSFVQPWLRTMLEAEESELSQRDSLLKKIIEAEVIVGIKEVGIKEAVSVSPTVREAAYWVAEELAALSRLAAKGEGGPISLSSLDYLIEAVELRVVYMASHGQWAPVLRTLSLLPTSYRIAQKLYEPVMLAGSKKILSLCMDPIATKFITNLIKNNHVDTSVLENTMMHMCDKHSLLNGARYILELIIRRRPDLHDTMARWLLKVEQRGLCFRACLANIVEHMIVTSPQWPSVLKLAKGYMNTIHDGVYRSFMVWEHGKVVFKTEKDAECHDFIAGRVLRDCRFEGLAGALYHSCEMLGSHFEMLAEEDPGLEEAVAKARCYMPVGQEMRR
jgi:hypothetical protein